ncbi:MAG: hypothetical protein M1832_005937 [Thelocarpon impressellum]|nr:MAG: hypothetical protein M1832_005937 [Thelocarpon impressellum]
MPPRRQRPPRVGALDDYQPVRIAGQIAALQGAWYASATVLIGFSALVAGRSFSVALVLGWRSLRGDTAQGWMLGFVWLLNGFFGSIFVLLIVARSKLVLDFALTLHALHLVATTLYSRALPASKLWWALQAASAAVMVGLGTWGCRWRELRPVSFGGGAAASQAESAETPGGGTGEGEEDIERGGFERGLRRGRGRDGAGVYEMVKMSAGTGTGSKEADGVD